MPTLRFQLLYLNKLSFNAVAGLTNVTRAVDCAQVAIKASSDDEGTHIQHMNVSIDRSICWSVRQSIKKRCHAQPISFCQYSLGGTPDFWPNDLYSLIRLKI